MKAPSFAKTKLGLLLLSSLFSLVLFIGAYEIFRHVEYYRWRETFDNFGWLGKVTVPSSNPVLMWEYRPYGEFREIKTNRYGFRDRDYASPAKPDNTLRIAFAGDSATLGMGVSLDQTFVRQFETLANKITFVNPSDPTAAPFSVQGLSFAVDGYNALQICELVRTKVLDFTPDKVVYVMCLNDFDFEYSSGAKILYFSKPPSFFWLMLEQFYQGWRGENYHRYHFDKRKDEVFQNILNVREILQQQDIGFELVILPIFPASFKNYPIRAIHAEIRAFLSANQIRHLDLLPIFAQSEKPPQHFAADVWHPNAEGHHFIAQCLLRSVLVD